MKRCWNKAERREWQAQNSHLLDSRMFSHLGPPDVNTRAYRTEITGKTIQDHLKSMVIRAYMHTHNKYLRSKPEVHGSKRLLQEALKVHTNNKMEMLISQ